MRIKFKYELVEEAIEGNAVGVNRRSEYSADIERTVLSVLVNGTWVLLLRYVAFRDVGLSRVYVRLEGPRLRRRYRGVVTSSEVSDDRARLKTGRYRPR